MTEIVARSESKNGGVCWKCRVMILKGNVIFKIAAKGSTTPQGNGPGHWVCGPCAYRKDTNELPHAG